MSAFSPKADMCGALANVRFVPEADIRETRPPKRRVRASGYLAPLLDEATAVWNFEGRGTPAYF